MQNILITGSNRGIGLAIVTEYLKHDDVRVFAACRNPDQANDLQTLRQTHQNLHIIQLDVSDGASIEASVQAISQITDHLDILINNAGVFPRDAPSADFRHLEAEKLAYILQTNSIAPVMVTQAYLPLLKNAQPARVVMVSSRLGSIKLAGTHGFGYRMSKAALNMAVKIMSQLVASENIMMITTHPGHVATDMGGSGAPVQAIDSAQGLIQLIDNLTPADSGKFYNYTGEKIPW